MESTNFSYPSSLMEAVRVFSDPRICLNVVAGAKWGSRGPSCPRCESKRHSFLKTRLIWKCLDCQKQFSVKVGTIFEDSPVGLDKWLCAMWLVANCKNGVSSYEIARDLKVTQATAWFMVHRIRYAMHNGSINKMTGTVEADETFIGGKARFMRAHKREQKIRGRGPMGKAIVFGLLERETGRVRTHHVTTRRKGELQARVREENFWSLLKRSIKGTYVSVEPFHLFRYLDEQSFRYNERHSTDAERFQKVLGCVGGKRLTYDQVRG